MSIVIKDIAKGLTILSSHEDADIEIYMDIDGFGGINIFVEHLTDKEKIILERLGWFIEEFPAVDSAKHYYGIRYEL